MGQDTPQLNPKQSALLLMDFQPAVLGSLDELSRSAVLERAQTALSWARSEGLAVVHVRVALTEADLAAISTNNRTFGGLPGTGMLVEGDSACEIVESLKPEPGETVVRKIRFGAFSTTDLGAQLRAAGVESLVLAGVSTGGVVLSTVRDAADQDFQLFVLADATADPDPTVHSVLVERVFPHQAYIITTKELSELV
jgi:nicotinamidase-related amidase